ncbi:protein WEAK CHLOROPLAST MOVEMENT UNDER BLUE LIGHT 1 [Phalaenopsis equestris]|uniref:protein WEAK CHLOROPLAST MOVEMENT UNDER BLUE LIGHT 1 n=1 Tax=Phalaenopsis equestris TaxID=78828 RepID=UPI0009E36E6B|nr:protein WEAK CHLOROPLAST MOVEMENT UNDER BLUE LIGHT 1 [Phalaenopsis equestris]
MADFQNSENLLVAEPTFSPEECPPKESTLPNPLLSDGKAEIKHHQEAATGHSEALVEQSCIGLSLETQPPSSLEFHCSSSPDLSHIQTQKLANIPAQHEDQSDSQDGVIKILKAAEAVPHKGQDIYCNDVSDVQTNKVQINDDATASAGSKAASLPSEKSGSIPDPLRGDASKGTEETLSSQIEGISSAGVADAQTNKRSNVEESSRMKDTTPLKPNSYHLQGHTEAQNMQIKSSESAVSTEHVKKVIENRGFVDTTTPFESVKDAVTKFGAIVDWKAHKALTIEKRKHFHFELAKVQEELPICRKQLEDAQVTKTEVLNELDTARRLVEELKLDLEKAETEAAQAKQDAELAQLRAKEMEDGIADDASVAAKTQLEVAKARHLAAIAEIKFVEDQLADLQDQYSALVGERDLAIRKAEEAVSALKEMEKAVEDLTLELISAKESLESAHAAHIEAEEHRIGAALAKDHDCLNWDKEIKQAEEELNVLNKQLQKTKNLETDLETALSLLANLKQELAAYMESKLKEQSESSEEMQSKDALVSKRKELEGVKANIEKAKNEVSILRIAESSLKSEFEREKTGLASMRQREGMASIAVSALEAEIERTKDLIKQVIEKEKEAREKVAELPNLIQQAALQADQFKSAAKMAREELRKVSEEAEQVKATLSTTEIRLQATLKEIEASRASERLALAAVQALQESEEAASMGESPRGISISLDEYYALSKSAHEVEQIANERIAYAVSQIQAAKESELKSLQRLEQAYVEMDRRKAALRVAMEKADKANEGKLGVEQELRKWRAEHEQQRKASDGGGHGASNPSRTPARSFNDGHKTKTAEAADTVSTDIIRPSPGHVIYMSGNKMEHVLPELKPRKSKFIIPRIVMFFVRRRSRSRK